MDRRMVTLLLVVFIDMVGFGVVIPILPLMIERIGGGTFLVGVVIAIFSLLQFIFSPVLGRLSDKYGRRPILILSSLVNAVSYFLIFLSQSFWIIIAGRVLAGIGSANLSVAQAYIADTSSSHERTRKMALVGAVFGLGFIVGPLIGGLASENFGLAYAFLAPAILSGLNTILIFLVLPESNKILQKNVKIEFFNLKVTKEILRPKNMSFLLFLFFFLNLALALIIGVFPIYAQHKFGWSETQNGYYFGLIGVGSFLTQTYFIGKILKIIDETKMVRIALVIFGVSVTLIGVTPFGWIAYVLAPFTSLGFSLMNVGVQSLISLESKPEEQGIVLGLSQSFASMARVIGPLTGGFIAAFNLSLPYILSGLISILILVFGQNYLRYMSANKGNKTPPVIH